LQEQSGAQNNTPTEINNDYQPSTISSLSSMVAKQPPAKRQKVGPIRRQNELLELACDFLKDSKNVEDKYLSIGKTWGKKLQDLDSMDSIQCKLAEKFINEILFEADMGNLHRGSMQINCHQDSGLSPGMTNNSSTLNTRTQPRRTMC
jgi:hypothetical protein